MFPPNDAEVHRAGTRIWSTASTVPWPDGKHDHTRFDPDKRGSEQLARITAALRADRHQILILGVPGWQRNFPTGSRS